MVQMCTEYILHIVYLAFGCLDDSPDWIYITREPKLPLMQIFYPEGVIFLGNERSQRFCKAQKNLLCISKNLDGTWILLHKTVWPVADGRVLISVVLLTCTSASKLPTGLVFASDEKEGTHCDVNMSLSCIAVSCLFSLFFDYIVSCHGDGCCW